MKRLINSPDIDSHLQTADEIVHKALTKCNVDLQFALDEVDKAFCFIHAPWIEYCVRETVMRWYKSANTRERKNVLQKLKGVFHANMRD